MRKNLQKETIKNTFIDRIYRMSEKELRKQKSGIDFQEKQVSMITHSHYLPRKYWTDSRNTSSVSPS